MCLSDFFIFVGQCDLHIIHINYILSELCQNLWAKFWMTFLIGGLHLSHGTSHVSNVFVAVVFLGQSGETSRWRVCFRLVFFMYKLNLKAQATKIEVTPALNFDTMRLKLLAFTLLYFQISTTGNIFMRSHCLNVLFFISYFDCMFSSCWEQPGN